MEHWLLRAGKTNPRKSQANSHESKLGLKADLKGGGTGAKLVKGAKGEIHNKPHWKSNLYAESIKLVLDIKIIIKWIIWECSTQSDSRKKKKKENMTSLMAREENGNPPKNCIQWVSLENCSRASRNEKVLVSTLLRKEHWRIHFYTVTKMWETKQRWQIHSNNKFNLVM